MGEGAYAHLHELLQPVVVDMGDGLHRSRQAGDLPGRFDQGHGHPGQRLRAPVGAQGGFQGPHRRPQLGQLVDRQTGGLADSQSLQSARQTG